MAIDGLTIIGESINDSVPSTKKLFDAGDLEGLKGLAKFQDESGAAWIDVNVGQRDGAFMAEMVGHIQSVTAKPLSIDTPDPALAAAGLDAYDQDAAGGALPILNSISMLRTEMFDILDTQRFMPILLVTERRENGQDLPNHTADETYQTACQLRAMAAECGLSNDQMIIDPGIAPIGSDSEGNLHRLMGAMELMHGDADFKGCHYSVGLSNFTVMIPPKRANGEPVKGPLESAFLTRAMPLGLDRIIGSVKRKYRLLEDGDDALSCFDDVLNREGFDCIMRVQEFYS